LYTAFDLPENWERDLQLVRIAVSDAFNKLLHYYAAKVGHETHRYHPFNTPVNHIIAKLGNESSLIFCRNYPVLVRGSLA